MKQLIFAAASMLACAFLTPAFAQTCCPAGCVQNAPNQCCDHWSGSEQLRQYFHLSPGAWRLVRVAQVARGRLA